MRRRSSSHRTGGDPVFFAALGAGAFAVACGGSDDTKSPVEVYAGQYSSAICGEMAPCCQANGLSFDQGQCALGGAGFFQQGVDANLQAGATFDASKADACIAASVAATKMCKPVSDDPTARLACALVWSGPKKVGQSCKSDVDCMSTPTEPGVCMGASANADGTCATRTSSAMLGDVCGKTANGDAPKTVADCDGNGLQCALLSQTCAPLVDLGGQCGEFNRCKKGLFCDDSGACATSLDTGATCSENVKDQCQSGLCVRGRCGENGVGSVTPCTGAKQ